MTLYEINRNIEDAIDAMLNSVNEETGEVDDAAANALAELQEAREQKLDNIGAYLKNLKVEADALTEESKALKSRADRKKKDIEKLKEYVVTCMGKEGLSKFESTRVKFSFRASQKVEVSDEDALPLIWKREVIKYEPDLEKIKAAIKAGETVPGAELVDRQNLQIK